MTFFYFVAAVLATLTALAFVRRAFALFAPDSARHRMRLVLWRLGLLTVAGFVTGCPITDPEVGDGVLDGGHHDATDDVADAQHEAGACGVLTCPPLPCSVNICPVGAFDNCGPTDSVTPCCLANGGHLAACSRPFGILTHDCAMYGLTSCASGRCAVNKGAVACCSETAQDPCTPPN